MKDSKTETLAENERRFKLIPLEPLRQQGPVHGGYRLRHRAGQCSMTA